MITKKRKTNRKELEDQLLNLKGWTREGKNGKQALRLNMILLTEWINDLSPRKTD